MSNIELIHAIDEDPAKAELVLWIVALIYLSYQVAMFKFLARRNFNAWKAVVTHPGDSTWFPQFHMYQKKNQTGWPTGRFAHEKKNKGNAVLKKWDFETDDTKAVWKGSHSEGGKRPDKQLTFNYEIDVNLYNAIKDRYTDYRINSWYLTNMAAGGAIALIAFKIYRLSSQTQIISNTLQSIAGFP